MHSSTEQSTSGIGKKMQEQIFSKRIETIKYIPNLDAVYAEHNVLN